MELTKLWDIQTLAYGILAVVIVIFVLIILAIMTRRVRNLASEVDSIRRDMRLLEEGIQTVTESLQGRKEAMPSIDEVLEQAGNSSS